MPTCPNCQHTWSTPTPKRAIASAPDLAQLTDRQLFEHYKRTAPVADTLFFAEHCGDAAIRNQAIALVAEAEQGLARTEVYKRLMRLQESWRVVRLGWPPADEDRFWRAVRRLGARERGKQYRQQRDQFLRHLREACNGTRATYYKRTPSWCHSDSIDDLIDQVGTEARALVRAARAICPSIDQPAAQTA